MGLASFKEELKCFEEYWGLWWKGSEERDQGLREAKGDLGVKQWEFHWGLLSEFFGEVWGMNERSSPFIIQISRKATLFIHAGLSKALLANRIWAAAFLKRLQFYWNPVTLPCLYTVRGCFRVTTTELSSCNSDHIAACQVESVYYLALYRKEIVNPCATEWGACWGRRRVSVKGWVPTGSTWERRENLGGCIHWVSNPRKNVCRFSWLSRQVCEGVPGSFRR